MSSYDQFIPVVLESSPENAHKFDTKLAQPLILEGEWEVGLQELIAPQTWNNINSENSKFSVKLPPKNEEERGK